MADKKVERSGRERPITPTEKMKSSLSDPGTMNMAEAAHDKGKSALVDRFRGREERWRREQSLHAQQAKPGHEVEEHGAEETDDDVLEDLLHAKPSAEIEPVDGEDKPKGGAL